MRTKDSAASTPDLDALLRALAEEDAEVEVAPRIERDVMHTWDVTRAVRSRAAGTHASLLRRFWLHTAAACFAVVVLAAFVDTTVVKVRDVTQPDSVGAPSRPMTSRGSPDDGGFAGLGHTVSDPSSLTVVRMRVPMRTLSHLPLPIVDTETSGSVVIEVLVGEDGVARSIRPVSAVTDAAQR